MFYAACFWFVPHLAGRNPRDETQNWFDHKPHLVFVHGNTPIFRGRSE